MWRWSPCSLTRSRCHGEAPAHVPDGRTHSGQVALLDQLIAPALRSCNNERRTAGLADLQALTELAQELAALLLGGGGSADCSPMTAVDLRSRIREVHDLPTPGVGFKDITPLLADPIALNQTISDLSSPGFCRGRRSRARRRGRAFILGAAIAAQAETALFSRGARASLCSKTIGVPTAPVRRECPQGASGSDPRGLAASDPRRRTADGGRSWPVAGLARVAREGAAPGSCFIQPALSPRPVSSPCMASTPARPRSPTQVETAAPGGQRLEDRRPPGRATAPSDGAIPRGEPRASSTRVRGGEHLPALVSSGQAWGSSRAADVTGAAGRGPWLEPTLTERSRRSYMPAGPASLVDVDGEEDRQAPTQPTTNESAPENPTATPLIQMNTPKMSAPILNELTPSDKAGTARSATAVNTTGNAWHNPRAEISNDRDGGAFSP